MITIFALFFVYFAKSGKYGKSMRRGFGFTCKKTESSRNLATTSTHRYIFPEYESFAK